VKEQRVGLLDRSQKNPRDVHARWPADGPQDSVCHVLRGEWLEALVDRGCPLRVAVKADNAELGLHHAGVNGRR